MNKQHTRPWAAWLMLAVQHFHLSPDQFWRLSMTEWQCLLRLVGAASDHMMSRDHLQTLMQLYPDGSHGH